MAAVPRLPIRSGSSMAPGVQPFVRRAVVGFAALAVAVAAPAGPATGFMAPATAALPGVAGLLGAAPLAAQIPDGVDGTFRPHPEAEKAISRLLSPFCPGFMLSQCPAAESLALRDSIQALALQGWNADALEAWMLANHGESYRAVPQRSGAGLLAWLLPPVALLFGAGVVGSVLRRRSGEAAPLPTGEHPAAEGSAAPAEGEPDPETEARLREAIRDLEFSEDPVY
jgi:cytochrome c-type biogenesis protein CcmH/NrfF